MMINDVEVNEGNRQIIPRKDEVNYF